MMLVYNKLGHLLKRDVSDFKSILKNNNFVLSTNVIKDLDGYELDLLISQVYKNDAFWNSNAGKYWSNLLPKADILNLFKNISYMRTLYKFIYFKLLGWQLVGNKDFLKYH